VTPSERFYDTDDRFVLCRVRDLTPGDRVLWDVRSQPYQVRFVSRGLDPGETGGKASAVAWVRSVTGHISDHVLFDPPAGDLDETPVGAVGGGSWDGYARAYTPFWVYNHRDLRLHPVDARGRLE